MAAVFPGGIKTYTATAQKNALPFDVVNSMQDEITAIETTLRSVILHDATYNDGSAHGSVSILNKSGRLLLVCAPHTSVVPFYANAGGGVSYRWTYLDPDTGWVVNTSGTFSFADASGLNTYTVDFNGGSGTLSVTRTAGSTAYRLLVMADFVAP